MPAVKHTKWPVNFSPLVDSWLCVSAESSQKELKGGKRIRPDGPRELLRSSPLFCRRETEAQRAEEGEAGPRQKPRTSAASLSPSAMLPRVAGELAAFGRCQEDHSTQWEQGSCQQAAVRPVGPSTHKVIASFYFERIYRQLIFPYLNMGARSQAKEEQKINRFFVCGFGLCFLLLPILVKLIKHGLWSQTDSSVEA